MWHDGDERDETIQVLRATETALGNALRVTGDLLAGRQTGERPPVLSPLARHVVVNADGALDRALTLVRGARADYETGKNENDGGTT